MAHALRKISGRNVKNIYAVHFHNLFDVLDGHDIFEKGYGEDVFIRLAVKFGYTERPSAAELAADPLRPEAD